MELMEFGPFQRLQNFSPEAMSRPLLSLRRGSPSETENDTISSSGGNSKSNFRSRDRTSRGGAGTSSDYNKNGSLGSGFSDRFEVPNSRSAAQESRRESSAASNILSTWGLTNALMTPNEKASKSDDRYVCPNDRQLSLRAKLGTGWSMRTHKRSRSVQPFSFTRRFSSRYSSTSAGDRRQSALSSPEQMTNGEDHFSFESNGDGGGSGGGRSSSACGGYESNISEGEMAVIQSVLKRADQITTMEQQRIGYATGEGANEIDIVIQRQLVLRGEWEKLYEEIRQCKQVCAEAGACMKTILSTGELGSLNNVYKASMVAMLAGSDFIKTSTGKESVNATLSVGIVMCRAIRDYYRFSFLLVLRLSNKTIKVGLKPAGGLKTFTHACQWIHLVNTYLGSDWLNPKLFRIGASSLLDDVIKELAKSTLGRPIKMEDYLFDE